MNILILNWKDIKHPQVGGAEIIVYELARRLVRDGHNVTWFCRGFKNGKKDDVLDGIHVVRRGNLLTMYLLAPIYYWSLPKKPDLVIDISNTVYWQSPLWAWKSKKIAYLNQLAQEVFYYEYPLLVSRIGIFLERFQYLTYRTTKFLCYSDSTKLDLIKVGISATNIKVFPLGLDHARYIPGKKSTAPLFVCVNRLVKMKRTDFVIRAMNIVRQTHPEARLVIVGTGYDRERLEKLRSSLELRDQVTFADENVWFFGKNSRDLKVKLMQQAWALVFPSVKEGWGMTVTECAACGTPAIVTDVSGLRDSVKDNITGKILPQDSSTEQLAGTMMELIDDAPLRKKLSANAILFAKTFSWEKSFQQFSKLISL